MAILAVAVIIALNSVLMSGQLIMVPGVLSWMGLSMLQTIWTPIAIITIVITFAVWLPRIKHSASVRSGPKFFIVLLLSVNVAMICALPDAQQLDRYLLPLLPLLGLVLIGEGPFRPKRALPILLMAVSLAWGVWATRFSYNVAEIQWREAERLVSSGVLREDIRGNWAWEGWHFWDQCLNTASENGRVDAAFNDCWNSKAETTYRIKLYSVFERKILTGDERYRIERLIQVRTLGIPAQVAVLVAHPKNEDQTNVSR